MKAYSFDPSTGEYIGECVAQESPKEKGVYLLPANSTDVAPSAAGDNESAVWDGVLWTIVDDFRGAVFWTDCCTRHVIVSLGEIVPDNLPTTPPPNDMVLIENGQWVDDVPKIADAVRAERDGRLAACDWTQLPDCPLDDTQKAEWVGYRQALRDVPVQQGFPLAVAWPVKPE